MNSRKPKIGFYLDNSGIPNVDLRNVEAGNPGVSGTHFMFCSIAYYLTLNAKYEVLLFCQHDELISNKIKTQKVKDVEAALDLSNDKNLDIFVYRPGEKNLKTEFYEKAKNTKLSIIAWAHNTPSKHIIKKIEANDQIKAFAAVGMRQMESLRDQVLFKKVFVLPNATNQDWFSLPETEKKTNQVIYLGSLTKAKGFHILAKSWPIVIKQVPNAELLVIGSGKLYNENKKLGKWGIAIEEYEKLIRVHLSDKNGDILSSVKFLGLLGKEKVKILKESAVGVVNPTGISETSMISAYEIMATGTPVVTGGFTAALDAVENGRNGFLVKNHKELADRIVYLLENPDLAKKMGNYSKDFVSNSFNYEISITAWTSLIDTIIAGNKIPDKPLPDRNFSTLFKEFFRKSREIVPFLNLLPSIEDFARFINWRRFRI